jgi:hypothetical protein
MDSVTDLGVEIDSNLSYQTHISNIVSKATQRVGILFRGFVTRDLNFMRKAYVSYIRPILEYNSIIWNPQSKQFTSLIEKVQRRFTKRIPSLRDFSYSERLAMINLEPLEVRRLRFDLINYYKILNNQSPIEASEHFNYYYPAASSRTASPKLLKAAKGNNSVMHSFFNRAIDCWNSLPHDLKYCSNIMLFKKRLSSIDLTQYTTVLE